MIWSTYYQPAQLTSVVFFAVEISKLQLRHVQIGYL
jgi:hypothetical protein